jgi:NADPH2:quinone reductase
VGVNYGDTAGRRGGYYTAPLPIIPGIEATGVVEAIAPDVTEVRVGQAVSFMGEPSAYAEKVAVRASRLIPTPTGVDARTACATLAQGRTAHYLAMDAYPIQSGDTVLIHSGAGGVGVFLVQIAKKLGARVISTVSTADKVPFVRDFGADEVIVSTEEDFAERTQALTGGEGVQAVFDANGRDTFDRSLDCVARRGHLVMYGAASGPPPPLDWAKHGRKSYYVSTHSGADYRATRDELLGRAGDIFRWVREGDLRVHIHKEYPLSEAAQAHRDLESRTTMGKLLLIP